MIMVDELREWPTSIRCFKAGSCHLFTDGHEDELHVFARRLGLRRGWFQPHPLQPHYDLTAARRAQALALGAVEVSIREWLRKRREAAILGHPLGTSKRPDPQVRDPKRGK